MLEEDRIRNHQCHLPRGIFHPLFKRCTSEARPALNPCSHLCRSVFAVVTLGTGSHQNRSDTVAFYIIVDIISCRNRKELYTRIRPYRAVILPITGTDAIFCHPEVQKERTIRVGNPKFHFRTIRIFLPIYMADRLKSDLLFIH